MTKGTLPVVEAYNLYTGYGQTRRKLRTATKVKFSDGTVIKFSKQYASPVDLLIAYRALRPQFNDLIVSKQLL